MAEGKSDAALAACMMAVDPNAIGGVSVRSPAGPQRDQFLALIQALMPQGHPFRRLPLNIGDDRLLGGLDLATTLQTRRPVQQRGLLAETSGGILVTAMAERLSRSLTARLAAALDAGEIVVERDGFGATSAAHIGIVALDEGIADDERPPQALLDRLAIHLDFTASGNISFASPFSMKEIETARKSASAVHIDDGILRVLCRAADQLGINEMRAPMLALKVARIHAALAGRTEANDEDAVVAARLVLAPRATMLPAFETEAKDDAEPQDGDQSENLEQESSQSGDIEKLDRGPLPDVVLEAAAAAIPPDLLARLQTEKTAPNRSKSSGRAGMLIQSTLRGRPIGARRGDLKSGVRLNLVETLRAAAPWQNLRKMETGTANGGVSVRREDFRVTRYKHRSETTTIFLVDSSGSSALHRLAEAKGAIELLLADCYVRRDQVALISFRGNDADLILPPTRSLARAKRTLAALPGGGGTPLAAAIDAGLTLANALRRKGALPTLVFLTDGRANVGRTASAGRSRALDEAYTAARACRALKLSALVVDTSPQPGPAAARLASEMGGRYVPLPYADALSISREIRRVSPPNESSVLR